MNPIYKFSILIGATETSVTPNYNTDISKDYDFEGEERFFRAKISGTFTFIRNDFDFINSQEFETEFIFLIYKSNNGGQTWSEYWRGIFSKTDCKFDEDNKTCIVEPMILDQYNKVLNGIEKEYDLIKLLPKIQPILIDKRPLLQVYIPGESSISCFLGGNYWQQDANEILDQNELVSTYYFSLGNLLKELKITVTGTPLAISGLYVGRMINTDGIEIDWDGNLYPTHTNDYYIHAFQQKDSPSNYSNRFYQIRRTSDDLTLFNFAEFPSAEFDNVDFVFDEPLNGATGTALAEMKTYNIFARYLLDKEEFNGLATYQLPTDDIVPDNRNYKRAIGYALDVFYISGNFSDNPTEWGLAPNDKYYLPPYSISGDTFYPISRTNWGYASIWFAYYLFDTELEKEGRTTYTLKDSYPLYSVVSKLLSQFAPEITHEPTEEYSKFLYGSLNPITNGKFDLFISQKSNILSGNYDKPAQKAPVTLKDLTNMLRDCFRCFWYIENNKFKIEHILYFQNGGSYTLSPEVQFNLTTFLNIKNNKPWGYDSKKWEFEKLDLPERFQFSWMDDVTLGFEGFPIEVLSKYVSKGKIEDVSLSKFTTDIDYLLLNPSEVSQDGFALMAAINANGLQVPDTGSFDGSEGTDSNTEPTYLLKTSILGKQAIAKFLGNSDSSGGLAQIVFYKEGTVISIQGSIVLTSTQQIFNIPVNIPIDADEVGFVVLGYGFFVFYDLEILTMFELPYVSRTANGIDYILQNGIMSFLYLHPNFYPYDLPAKVVKINNQEIEADGITKKKKQKVSFPSINDPETIKLITTSLGNGEIHNISVNLHSRMNTIELRYDTE